MQSTGSKAACFVFAKREQLRREQLKREERLREQRKKKLEMERKKVTGAVLIQSVIASSFHENFISSLHAWSDFPTRVRRSKRW